MYETGCLGPVHGMTRRDRMGRDVGAGSGVQDGEHMYTHG